MASSSLNHSSRSPTRPSSAAERSVPASFLSLLLFVGIGAILQQMAAAVHGLAEMGDPRGTAISPSARQPQILPSTAASAAPASGSTHPSAAKTAQQWMAEGQKAQKAGNQMQAIYDFLNAQRLDPTSPEPLYAEGMSFFLIGWDENDSSYYDRAAHHFKEALALDSNYDRAAFMMGMMEVVHFRLKEAEPYFQKALAVSPRNPFYHHYYGTLLERMGNYDGAVAQMLLAEKLDPTYTQSYLALGQLYFQKKKYLEARAQLERAVQLDPHLASAYFTLGGVYHHLGMNAESEAAYKTFNAQKAAQPESDPLQRAMQGGSGASSK
jgi:tetratricopeptide (TPR) repeat protein